MLMDQLLLKRNTKVLVSIPRKVKMLIHHDFIHTSIFFHWSLPSLLNRTKGQLKYLAWGEELAIERVVEVAVRAKQQIRIVMQTVSVCDIPAMKWLNVRWPDTVWKQLNGQLSDIFPYFSSKSKYLYENVLPLFTILKHFQVAKNFKLYANPVYRVQSHPRAWHLENFQWHGWTQSSNNFIFLFEIYQFSLENTLPSFTILKHF